MQATEEHLRLPFFKGALFLLSSRHDGVFGDQQASASKVRNNHTLHIKKTSQKEHTTRQGCLSRPCRRLDKGHQVHRFQETLHSVPGKQPYVLPLFLFLNSRVSGATTTSFNLQYANPSRRTLAYELGVAMIPESRSNRQPFI